MGKSPIIAVALLLFGVFRLQSADLAAFADSLPIGAAPASATTSTCEGVVADGEQTQDVIPDISFWFDQDAEADALAAALWTPVEEFLTDAEGAAGWTAICVAATAVTVADRSADPLPGALTCSQDATVTELQQLSVAILRTQASTALWLRGVPGRD